mmetsp:Transcript_20628/g.53943  ORF Transcript_20628/g.53943 Transcript_20628/m.53943 type:complete len:279 (+) Transcript_20628:98-934(+)
MDAHMPTFPASFDYTRDPTSRSPRLLHLLQVVRHLRRREYAELVVLVHDGDLDVVARDLPLEALLQREQRGVDRVLQLHLLAVPLLQERLGVGHVLPDGGGLPGKVGAGGVNLVQLRPVVVKAGHQEGDAKGAHATGLGELLHDRGRLADQLRHGDGLLVQLVVSLRLVARLAHQHPRVGPHARVRHPDVGRQQRHLGHRAAVHQRARQLLLRRDHHPVGRFYPQRGGAGGDRLERVLDLHQLAAGAESRQGEGVLRVPHLVPRSCCLLGCSELVMRP